MSQSPRDAKDSEEIDGYKYRVYMMDPMTAADLLADIGYILSPAIGALGGVLAKEKGDVLEKALEGFDSDDNTQVDGAVERAVMGFFQRFSKEKQREFMGIMAKHTEVVHPDGTTPKLSSIFAVHFRGRIKAMYRWFAFALKTQFQDFFSGQSGLISQFAQKASALQNASNTPTI